MIKTIVSRVNIAAEISCNLCEVRYLGKFEIEYTAEYDYSYGGFSEEKTFSFMAGDGGSVLPDHVTRGAVGLMSSLDRVVFE